jgi:hypothetical protein
MAEITHVATRKASNQTEEEADRPTATTTAAPISPATMHSPTQIDPTADSTVRAAIRRIAIV